MQVEIFPTQASLASALADWNQALLRQKPAAVLRQAVQGPVTPRVPASFLQLHPRFRWLSDSATADHVGWGPARRS